MYDTRLNAFAISFASNENHMAFELGCNFLHPDVQYNYRMDPKTFGVKSQNKQIMDRKSHHIHIKLQNLRRELFYNNFPCIIEILIIQDNVKIVSKGE